MALLILSVMWAVWCIGADRTAPDFITESMEAGFTGLPMHHRIEVLIAASEPDDVHEAVRNIAQLHLHNPERILEGDTLGRAPARRRASGRHSAKS